MATECSWLIGFEFRTASGRIVHHFYLVSGTPDPELARTMALERADAPGERAARGGLCVDGDRADTRRLVCDPLGVRRLSAPSGF
ncbi:hypothetical protein [Streptomyces sp. NPDC057428]|uniref:hypothetical protein n=1 Tax=Streptomyces sp. NPDC057428 TaxID=3346129 RepID=UPI003683353D